MPKLLIIEKLGSLKETTVKESGNDLYEILYKKAGFKVATGFQLHHTYTDPSDPTYTVDLYGKTSGRAGQENKYDLPPPLDNHLFFGSCILVGKKANQVVDITTSRWETIYEALFGGFEDINGSEQDDSGSEDLGTEEAKILNDPETKFTKQGYVKDDFIVDDDDDDDDYEDEDEDEEEEEEEVVVVAPKKKPTSKVPVQAKTSSSAGRDKDLCGRSERPDARGRSRETTCFWTRQKTSRKPATKKSEPARESYTCSEELTEEEYFAT